MLLLGYYLVSSSSSPTMDIDLINPLLGLASHDGLHARWLGISPDLTPDQVAKFDFDDKRTRICHILAINILVIILITFFVSVRFYVRGFMTRRFFLDDGKSRLCWGG
jgi:hypothetical protein